MKNEYVQNLCHSAYELDIALHFNGKIIQSANNLIEENDDNNAISLCYAIKIALEKGVPEITLKAKLLKDALIDLYGYRQLTSICKSNQDSNCVEEGMPLDQLLTELNNLVGLEKVKSKVNNLISFQKVQFLRNKAGLSVPKNTLHLAFTGNPGTGKTTVARIVGRIYKQIGLLSKGHFMEVSRTDLIAGYQGQTALKVKEVINKAKGGVLFIDEAYSITENDHSDSYGRECLTELTKALEDYRDDLVVIVAGYTEPMKKFFDSNPGLRSRFNTFVQFDDYSADELMKILEVMCNKEDYILEPSLVESIKISFAEISKTKEDQFANGRFIRNLFEDMMMNHARRLANKSAPSVIELQTFTEADIPQYLRSRKDNA